MRSGFYLTTNHFTVRAPHLWDMFPLVSLLPFFFFFVSSCVAKDPPRSTSRLILRTSSDISLRFLLAVVPSGSSAHKMGERLGSVAEPGLWWLEPEPSAPDFTFNSSIKKGFEVNNPKFQPRVGAEVISKTRSRSRPKLRLGWKYKEEKERLLGIQICL